MSSTSQERIQAGLMTWKPEDFERNNSMQKTLDPPKHGKMGSGGITEMAVVPPIIQNGRYSDPKPASGR